MTTWASEVRPTSHLSRDEAAQIVDLAIEDNNESGFLVPTGRAVVDALHDLGALPLAEEAL